MTEDLKQVIAKIKAKQNSQQSNKVVEKPAKKEIPAPVPQEIEEEDDYVDEEEEQAEEMPKAHEKVAPKPSNEVTDAQKEQIIMEIEMLQNNGRYRAELLHQLQEINKALVVIAGVLVDLTGNGKGTA